MTSAIVYVRIFVIDFLITLFHHRVTDIIVTIITIIIILTDTMP